jgi:hypothetical protein
MLTYVRPVGKKQGPHEAGLDELLERMSLLNQK